MGRPLKTVTYSDPTAAILGENIFARLPIVFGAAKTETAQIEALSRRCGIVPETIRRIAKGEVSPTLKKLDTIARGLGCHVWELLKPSDGKSESDEKTRPFPKTPPEAPQPPRPRAT